MCWRHMRAIALRSLPKPSPSCCTIAFAQAPQQIPSCKWAKPPTSISGSPETDTLARLDDLQHAAFLADDAIVIAPITEQDLNELDDDLHDTIEHWGTIGTTASASARQEPAFAARIARSALVTIPCRLLSDARQRTELAQHPAQEIEHLRAARQQRRSPAAKGKSEVPRWLH